MAKSGFDFPSGQRNNTYIKYIINLLAFGKQIWQMEQSIDIWIIHLYMPRLHYTWIVEAAIAAASVAQKVIFIAFFARNVIYVYSIWYSRKWMRIAVFRVEWMRYTLQCYGYLFFPECVPWIFFASSVCQWHFANGCVCYAILLLLLLLLNSCFFFHFCFCRFILCWFARPPNAKFIIFVDFHAKTKQQKTRQKTIRHISNCIVWAHERRPRVNYFIRFRLFLSFFPKIMNRKIYKLLSFCRLSSPQLWVIIIIIIIEEKEKCADGKRKSGWC